MRNIETLSNATQGETSMNRNEIRLVDTPYMILMVATLDDAEVKAGWVHRCEACNSGNDIDSLSRIGSRLAGAAEVQH